jgi:fructokinase
MTASEPDATIIGLGEILWDRLPAGPQPGGAPFNFAIQVQQMGHSAAMLSAVGDDALGHEIVGLARDRGVDISGVTTDPLHPTGAVDVLLDANGVARYEFLSNVAWDYLEPSSHQLALAARARAICFGTLAQRTSISCDGVHSLLAKAANALVVCDVNLRQAFYSADVIHRSLERAQWAKLNNDEIPVCAKLLGLPNVGLEESARLLQVRYQLDLVAVTMGASGSILITPDNCWRQSALPVTVADTVGAGDAFTAGLIIRYLEGASFHDMLIFASTLAGITATRRGGTPLVTRHEVEAGTRYFDSR